MVANPTLFTIEGALRAGWRAFAANFVPMALYGLAVLVVGVVLNRVVAGEDAGFVMSSLSDLVVFIVNQVVAIGWLRLALDITDGRAVSMERVRASFGVLLPFALAAILFSIMLTVGMVLLIVPGIIVALVFGFYGWILVDGRETSPVDALRRSAAITRGERMHLFGLGVVLLLLNVLGLLVFFVGVLVTGAVSILALAHVYRQLEAAGGREAEPRDAVSATQ